MSKKTQKIDSGQHTEARLKRAKEVLEMHPTRDKVYFTADGEAFIEPQYANMHAATKPDTSVVAVTRDEAFATAPDPVNPNPENPE